MRRILLVMWVVFAATGLAVPTGLQAQMGGVVILDDPLNEVQLQAEHEDINKLLNDPEKMARAGLKKHDYCLTCRGGAKRPCVSPFGGETGKVFCASQCTYKCRSACGVAPTAC